MKKTIILIVTVLFALTSCVKDNYDEPEFIIPSFTLSASDTLITIAQLKTIHTTNGQLDSIKNNWIISGTVVGNDQFGNIYKTMFIQDETGGMLLSINKTNLYNDYKLGQKVYVKCKNLVLGDYSGNPQLGAIYNGGTGQLPAVSIPNHFFRDGLPVNVPAPIHIRSASDLSGNVLSMLVQLDSCTFVNPGSPFTENDDDTDRELKIKDGTKIIVRTSNYAAFANRIIPGGKGTIIGILSIYDGDYQLIIRSIDDVFGFPTPTIIVSEDIFSTNPLQWATTKNWTAQNVSGTQTWGYDAAYKYMIISGFSSGSNYANEDWLISPSFSTAGMTNALIAFEHAAKFGSPATELHLMISSNYDETNFSSATWTELNVPNWPDGSNWNFINSGDIDISSFLGQNNLHIAFKYTSSTSSSTTWEIKKFQLKKYA